MKYGFFSILCAVSVWGNDLHTLAYQNGLKPIPNNPKDLNKIIDNKTNSLTHDKIELGKMLYFDPRLSKSGLVSCNTCHNLGLGGSDGMSATIGDHWTIHPKHLNSPTVYNAVFYERQSWDGRNPDLEDQASGPILAKPVMGATKEQVVHLINSAQEYKKRFKKVFGHSGDIPFESVGYAIAAFERTLVTPSRYDDFLNGKKNALSKAEQKGLKTFIDKGCVTCHNDIALGGTMQPLGVVEPYKYKHIGTFTGGKNGMVRVPTLRNITQTAPYFHNGKIETLYEAIQEMGRIQLGIYLNDNEIAEIQTFLKALEGKKPTVIYPMLPASTDKIPKLNVVRN